MLLEIEDSDYEPLSRFDLLWRWTSPSHPELTPDVLDSIRPIGVVRAAIINEFAVRGGDRLNSEFGQNLRQYQTRGADESVVKEWLDSLPIPADETVVVSWDAQTAVTTPFAVVAQHWSDFFYPSSDDATVIPPNGEWMLMWHHHELFEFGSASPLPPDPDQA